MISKSKSPKKRIIRLSLLVIICIGTILLGGVYYISSLRTSLMDQAVHNVLAVTIQQQQASMQSIWFSIWTQEHFTAIRHMKPASWKTRHWNYTEAFPAAVSGNRLPMTRK